LLFVEFRLFNLLNMYKKILSFLIKRTIIYIDILIHRKRIRNFLINTDLKINTIFDVGSNDSDYSLLFNQIYPNAEIYAFEPNPYLIEIALKKTKQFQNIKIIPKAVGNLNSLTALNIDQNSSLTTSLAVANKNSTTYKIKKFLYGNKAEKKTTIEIIKLDSFIKSDNCPDFVKIDVEGFEEKVLKGLTNNLTNIKLVMIEFHFDKLYKEYSTLSIHKLLTKNNFKLIKSIKFPILKWEDRFYINTKLANNF
tara:strand:- start:34 stop:789 length:756 start_codon:yes stop_codon:yes gene_type:complete